jgi:superfamily I DNA/RNA helicase
VATDDYLHVLRALAQLPFTVGRQTLLAILAGDRSHETVRRNRLDTLASFAALGGYSEEEIDALLGRLVGQGHVMRARPLGKRFTVLELTAKGREELKSPVGMREHAGHFVPAQITQEDRILFEALDFFLHDYNDEQKQAIVSRAKRILCVAGAGTGKTTVLTKRVEFLVNFVGVPKERILAITFTRKAKEEMHRRLHGIVQVETFNSFCEKLLLRHEQLAYGKPVRMISYQDRMRLLHHAVRKTGMDIANVLELCMSARKHAERSKEQLVGLLAHDCFAILDYYASSGEEMGDFARGAGVEAKLLHTICAAIRHEMRELGLRDYPDQLRDCLQLLRGHPKLIARFDHVLVDEYQDVNQIQQELIDVLRPQNLFVVGDPRQSIFGWRGSKVRLILDFAREDAETVILRRNYRSGAQIVRLANAAIRRMQLPDLSHERDDARIHLHAFPREDDELDFIAQRILRGDVPREQIFVLTRTNRQLRQLSTLFAARGIAHITRSDEQRLVEAQSGQVTLSTVHAIKGLEAQLVFVPHCTTQSYPCIASDSPALELVRREEHDREEEELRLFYVAITRARDELHISHVGTPSKFITSEMRKLLGVPYNATLTQAYRSQGAQGELFSRLRSWRSETSRRLGVPAYMVFSDRTLLLLAQQQPAGMDDLHQIAGIGPVKAQKYGEDVLAILRGDAS